MKILKFKKPRSRSNISGQNIGRVVKFGPKVVSPEPSSLQDRLVAAIETGADMGKLPDDLKEFAEERLLEHFIAARNKLMGRG